MEVEPPVAATNSPLSEEDFVMVEATEVQGAEEDANPAPKPPSAQAGADEDMGVEIQQEKRPDIKLEDLFEGMDSDDDEFPSSSKPA
jgi:DNA primase small subunit